MAKVTALADLYDNGILGLRSHKLSGSSVSNLLNILLNAKLLSLVFDFATYSAGVLNPAFVAIFDNFEDPIPLEVPINCFLALGSRCCLCCNALISSSDNVCLIDCDDLKYSLILTKISPSSIGFTFNFDESFICGFNFGIRYLYIFH